MWWGNQPLKLTLIDSGNPEEEFIETQSNNSSPSPNTQNKVDSPVAAAATPAGASGNNNSIYAKAQEALRAHYQHMGLIMLWISKLYPKGHPLIGIHFNFQVAKSHNAECLGGHSFLIRALFLVLWPNSLPTPTLLSIRLLCVCVCGERVFGSNDFFSVH